MESGPVAVVQWDSPRRVLFSFEPRKIFYVGATLAQKEARKTKPNLLAKQSSSPLRALGQRTRSKKTACMCVFPNSHNHNHPPPLKHKEAHPRRIPTEHDRNEIYNQHTAADTYPDTTHKQGIYT